MKLYFLVVIEPESKRGSFLEEDYVVVLGAVAHSLTLKAGNTTLDRQVSAE